MSAQEQFSLFEDGGRLIAAPTEETRRTNCRVADAPRNDGEETSSTASGPPSPCAGKARPTRMFKLGLWNGESLIIKTDKSMFELANEMRGRSRIGLTTIDGEQIACSCDTVRSIEHYYRSQSTEDNAKRR